MDSTVILDWGSHTFKAGTAVTFPSEDEPQIVIPSAVRADEAEPAGPSGAPSETRQVVDQGRITDWPGFEVLTHHCLYSQADQERLAQLMFEEFNVAGLFMCTQPVLSAFALGKLTCLVTDIGHDKTDVAAVIDGALHPSSSQRRMQGCAQAARAMTSLLQPVLQDRQPSAHSMQQLFEDTASIAESPEELSSMLQQAGADLFFPEELPCPNGHQCHAARCDLMDNRQDSESTAHTLPDGETISVRHEAVQAAESLVTHLQPAHAADTSLADAIFASASCQGDSGLRKACLETLLVCGGGSCIPGITRRLVSELHQLCPPSVNPQPVTCPEYMPEQTLRFSSWMGGAILSKIAFQQNQHASKYDYHESGPGIIHRKCG